MLRAAVVTVLFCLNLALWGTPVLLGGLVKLVLPPAYRLRWILMLVRLADRWVAGNNWIMHTLLPTEWDVDGIDGVNLDGRYLVLANHISWVDIPAIFKVFHGKSAFVRFFLKSGLIWFPVLGQACWAIEFPFMKRYTPEYLAKHPEKRGEDLKTTQQLCSRYRSIPVTVLNFIEGTRFTEKKKAQQNSPYRRLLRPRSGGLSFALASMGEQLDKVFDLTLAYPGHDISMYQFISGQVPKVVIRVREVPIPDSFRTNAVTEAGPVRAEFKLWLNQLWAEKDALLEELLATKVNGEELPERRAARG